MLSIASSSPPVYERLRRLYTTLFAAFARAAEDRVPKATISHEFRSIVSVDNGMPANGPPGEAALERVTGG